MFDVWKLLAGVAIFILGMNFLEEAVRQLSGRKFKLLLKKHTGNPVTAIGGGAVVTGILQSSSIVNLMVLALVGSGTIPMKNALAVILGANVGTTLSTWVIAAIGFELNIEALAFPLIAVTGIARVIVRSKSAIYNWTGFLLGLGFLFLGLEIMKSGMISSIQTFDPSILKGYPIFIYLIAGLIITSLIQSSTATVAIVLSALFAQAIDQYATAALVLGSEVGTTIKLLIVSVGREANMKRVALGNFLFNMITALVIFVFLLPINRLIADVAGVHNPFIALAFFQTFINVFSIFLFYPMLSITGRYLESRFKNDREGTKFIGSVLPTDTDLAIIAMTNETILFLRNIVQYTYEVFSIRSLEKYDQAVSHTMHLHEPSGKYELIKKLHGELYAYYIGVQRGLTNESQAQELYQLVSAARNGMYAAKNMKDSRRDIEQLKSSANDTKYRFYEESSAKAGELLDRLMAYLNATIEVTNFEELVAIYKLIQTGYTETLNTLYSNDHTTRLSDAEISTLINLNREIFSGMRSLLFGMKDVRLSYKEAKYFDDLPSFTR